jgi:hypothetical protein
MYAPANNQLFGALRIRSEIFGLIKSCNLLIECYKNWPTTHKFKHTFKMTLDALFRPARATGLGIIVRSVAPDRNFVPDRSKWKQPFLF